MDKSLKKHIEEENEKIRKGGKDFKFGLQPDGTWIDSVRLVPTDDIPPNPEFARKIVEITKKRIRERMNKEDLNKKLEKKIEALEKLVRDFDSVADEVEPFGCGSETLSRIRRVRLKARKLVEIKSKVRRY